MNNYTLYHTILLSLHFPEDSSLTFASSLTIAHFLDFSNPSMPRSRAMRSTEVAQDPAEGWRVSDFPERNSLAKARTHNTHCTHFIHHYVNIIIWLYSTSCLDSKTWPLGISWAPFETGPRNAQSAGFTEAIAAPPAMLASPEVMASEASFNKFLPELTRWNTGDIGAICCRVSNWMLLVNYI